MLMDKKFPYCNPELWGGIECTINRVGDTFRDQLLNAEHYTRPGDIEAFAALGIRALRYPVLWELHEPEKNKAIDWSWISRQLDTLRKHHITPIAGLVHHGSGPAYTNLCDPRFAEHLAEYAAKVATQFPWLEYYTPVNEPLTTARFSGLYGLWYPHYQNAHACMTMLLNQLKGVVLSMQAIRKINPQAKLVQTEDLAKVHSTPLLGYQAAFENERRWLTIDLLCGRVNEQHPLWEYLMARGIEKSTLLFFGENPCPPDIMGFNYYVTSERYLDENLHHYPSFTHGGNGRHTYADVEAVRVTDLAGIETLLTEAWNRYHVPMAVTEAHLSCTREEQMRWFKEIWDAACQLKRKGVDIRAVTAWSLLGAYDWNSLLTKQANYYEAGVFDIRSGYLRPTAMAAFIRSLAQAGHYQHPLLQEKGWWRKNGRFINRESERNHTGPNNAGSPLLIVENNGNLLTAAFVKSCEERGIAYKIIAGSELKLHKNPEIEKAIDIYKPWAIVDTTGHIIVEEEEIDQEKYCRVTVEVPALRTNVRRKNNISCVSFSADAAGQEVFYMAGDVREHTYIPELVNTALDLLIDGEEGSWPVCKEGFLMWPDFACVVEKRGEQEKKQDMVNSLSENDNDERQFAQHVA